MAIKETMETLDKSIETKKINLISNKQQAKYLPLIFGDIKNKELLALKVIMSLG